ncbi:hypothetical protein PI124_g10351 [Phytophthora idaei]|nr:hypothetical protein PI126_g8300 [Phytophthora idaei]KAG3244899.1 hypothetical protein PI124_g10351 [Phytophthora idaei]
MAFQAPPPTATSVDKVKSPDTYFDLNTPEDTDGDIESGALRAGGVSSIWSLRNIGIGQLLLRHRRLRNEPEHPVRRHEQLPLHVRSTDRDGQGFGEDSSCPTRFPVSFLGHLPNLRVPSPPLHDHRLECCLHRLLHHGRDSTWRSYYEDSSLQDIDLADMTPEQLALVHPDAPHRGNKFIFLFMVANLGAVIAYGPTYGIFIELSQREPEHIRGRLQTNVFMVRNALAIVTAFLTGLCLNSTEYGGTFSWTIGFNGIMWICTAATVITIPFCWFCVTEEKVEQTKSIGTFYKEIYEIIQKEPFYRLFIFRYFTKIFAAVSVTASSNIQSIYAGVTPLKDGIAACISQILIVAGIFSIKKWGLQWNWQYLAIFSQLFAVFVDAFPTYFTIWNVFRSQWFWLGVPLLEDFVGEFVDYATTITMVEIAEPGREATSMGFLGSITAAAQPFGTVITKSVDSYFEIGQKALKRDDHAVHKDLTYAYLIAYLFNIAAVVFAFLLPRQKHEAQAMKQNGNKSKLIGTASVVIFLFSVVWAIMTHLLSLWDSTSCLRIAGGSGC